MTLDQLKYFYEAARFQHVGKAAKSVAISPSAVSSAISSLELELGKKLFARVGKSVVLTREGRVLMEEAARLLGHVAAVAARVRGEPETLGGEYRVGASHFLASNYLLPAWSKLQSAHPELRGEVTALPTALVLREIVTGALDFGLCFSPLKHPDLDQSELHRGRLRIAVRRKHPLAMGRRLKSIADVSSYPAVLHKDRPGVDLCEEHPVFARFGVKPKLCLAFDDDACAAAKLVCSDAWSLLPEMVLQAYSKELVALPHPKGWDAAYSVALVYRRDKAHVGVIRAMKDIINW